MIKFQLVCDAAIVLLSPYRKLKLTPWDYLLFEHNKITLLEIHNTQTLLLTVQLYSLQRLSAGQFSKTCCVPFFSNQAMTSYWDGLLWNVVIVKTVADVLIRTWHTMIQKIIYGKHYSSCVSHCRSHICTVIIRMSCKAVFY